MSDQSVIGETTRVRGNINGEGSLFVAGYVEGDVQVSGDLTLADTGRIRGNIRAASVLVAGQIHGDIASSDSIQLEASAKVVGNLSGARIGVAEGALVRGLVETFGEASPAPAKQSAAAASLVGGRTSSPRPAISPARPAIAARSYPESTRAPARTQSSPVVKPSSAVVKAPAVLQPTRGAAIKASERSAPPPKAAEPKAAEPTKAPAQAEEAKPAGIVSGRKKPGRASEAPEASESTPQTKQPEAKLPARAKKPPAPVVPALSRGAVARKRRKAAN